MRIFRLGAALFSVVWTMPASAQDLSRYGPFEGYLDGRFLDDGVNVELLALYKFIDPDGKNWESPKGVKSDGASIPRFLWALVGSPWTGKYRNAAVIHDRYCNTKSEPWQAVHRVFYYAMLANGVPETQAKVMYTGVYRFGPRWNIEYKPTCQNCVAVSHHVDEYRPGFNQNEFYVLKRKAETPGVSLEELEREANRLFMMEIETKQVGKPATP
jgi:hypothetical protein